jgi:hypothetical protein
MGPSAGGLNIVGINQSNNMNGRIISSELTSYQSEKKISSIQNDHNYNSGGRGAGVS